MIEEISIDINHPYLINLSEDPLLTKKVTYSLKEC